LCYAGCTTCRCACLRCCTPCREIKEWTTRPTPHSWCTCATFCFSGVSITGTMAEQAFCVARNVVRANSTEGTNADALQHFLSVRARAMEVTQQQMAKDSASTTTTPSDEIAADTSSSESDGDQGLPHHRRLRRRRKPKSRPFRSASSRVFYCVALRMYGKRLRAAYCANIRSVKSLRGMGKKLNALYANSADIEDAMTTNFQRKRRKFGKNLRQFSLDNDEAKLNDAKKLRTRETDAQIEAANRRRVSEQNAMLVLTTARDQGAAWKNLNLVVLKSAAVVLLAGVAEKVASSAKKCVFVQALEQVLPQRLQELPLEAVAAADTAPGEQEDGGEYDSLDEDSSYEGGAE